MFTAQNRISDFLDDESGAGTAFALGWAIVCIAIGGLSIDSSHVWAVKQRMQSTADIAAHAGIMRLVHPGRFDSSTSVSQMAIEAAEINMPVAQYGSVLVAADVLEGNWNQAALTMNTLVTTPNAVAVTIRMDGDNSSAIPTFILKLIGFDYWRASASSVFQRNIPDCVLDGLMAGGMVDLTSNNDFANDICMHGHEGVQLTSNNTFDPGVSISMADPRIISDGGDFDPQGNGNIGMWDALTASALIPELATLQNLSMLFATLADPYSEMQKDYIDVMVVNEIALDPRNPFDMADIVIGAVNIVECGRGVSAKVDIPPNTTVRNVVIITDCPINMGMGSAVEDAILMTTSTSANSFRGANGVRLGLDDNCQPGGGAQFITMGGINFASSMEYYGSQIIAHDDINMAAAVQGIEGISLQTAGDITVTANNEMGLCGGGVDMVQTQVSYRMVN